MSRSRRKNPAGGIACCASEKDDKRAANRRFRRMTRERIHIGTADAAPMRTRDVSDRWVFGKDGKAWYGTASASTYPHLIRK